MRMMTKTSLRIAARGVITRKREAVNRRTRKASRTSKNEVKSVNRVKTLLQLMRMIMKD